MAYRKPQQTAGKPVYQILAQKINAMQNCDKANNMEWHEKHRECIEELIKDWFPHGSGIDGDHGEFDYSKCDDKKLVFYSQYHFMDENGFYDGWYDFKVVVESSLMFGFNVRIVIGRRMRNHGVGEYLGDMYHETFHAMLEEC